MPVPRNELLIMEERVAKTNYHVEVLKTQLPDGRIFYTGCTHATGKDGNKDERLPVIVESDTIDKMFHEMGVSILVYEKLQEEEKV